MDPARLKIRTVWLKVSDAGNANPFELTLSAQDFHEALWLRTCLSVSVEVYDVIEVAWPRPLCERSKFFGERLDVVICQNLDTIVWSVAIWVENLRADRWQDHTLVSSQIKLDPRKGMRR
jgi:hypothetical protein